MQSTIHDSDRCYGLGRCSEKLRFCVQEIRAGHFSLVRFSLQQPKSKYSSCALNQIMLQAEAELFSENVSPDIVTYETGTLQLQKVQWTSSQETGFIVDPHVRQKQVQEAPSFQVGLRCSVLLQVARLFGGPYMNFTTFTESGHAGIACLWPSRHNPSERVGRLSMLLSP